MFAYDGAFGHFGEQVCIDCGFWCDWHDICGLCDCCVDCCVCKDNDKGSGDKR
jgi:hypothetical protein